MPLLFFNPYLETFTDEYQPFGVGLDELDNISVTDLLRREHASDTAMRFVGGKETSALYSLWHAAILKHRGVPMYPMSSTSGLLVNLATDVTATSLNNWGWQHGAYWLTQATTVAFPVTGSHTMRIQVREDGVRLDQIVLSSVRFATAPPGPVTNDATIVAKP